MPRKKGRKKQVKTAAAKIRRRGKIAWQISLWFSIMIVLIISALSGLLVWFANSSQTASLKADYQKRMRAMGSFVGENVSSYLASMEFTSIQSTLEDTVSGDNEMLYAMLVDPQNLVKASNNKEQNKAIQEGKQIKLTADAEMKSTAEIEYIHDEVINQIKEKKPAPKKQEEAVDLTGEKKKEKTEPIITEYYRKTEGKNQRIQAVDVAYPIWMDYYDGKGNLAYDWGYVRLGFSLELLQEEIQQVTVKLITLSVVIAVAALVFGILVSILVGLKISKPIKKIVEVTQKVAEGDLRSEVDIRRNDELGILADSFNEMIHSLRKLATEILQTSDTVAASSEQLAAGAESSKRASDDLAKMAGSLAEGADQQNKSVVSTSETLVEMSSLISGVSEKAKVATESSEATFKTAGNGSEALKKVTSKMKEIKSIVDQSATVIQKLGESSNRIGKIVELITDISEQIKLLSLNAAIEAARAGEYGRGFAVVASEVQKLAEKTSESANNISSLITSIQTETQAAVNSIQSGTEKVSEGTVVVDETGSILQEIMVAAQQTAQLNREILETAGDQVASSDQIMKLIDSIASISESTSANAEELAASTQQQAATASEVTNSAGELAKVSVDMQALTQRFKMES